MELSEFRQKRAEIESEIRPYKIVRLDEIKQVENKVYNIGDLDVKLSDRAQGVLNRAIGTTAEQLRIVKGCSGDSGQANFRNYLSVAKNISEEKQVVLIADPESRKVSNVIIPKEDFIPAGAFFDFAEMFVDSTGNSVEKVEWSHDGNMGVRIFLQSAQPVVQPLLGGEDFFTDGLYLQWNGASIEMGCYFTRLVCMNGQTMETLEKGSVIYALNPETISGLVQLANSNCVWQKAFDKFREKALEAMDTNLSLRELKTANSRLRGNMVNLPDEMAASLAPYNDYLEYFNKTGVDLQGKMHLVKTDINWWEFYNNLTRFATHNTFMADDDIARSYLDIIAVNLLLSKHDIQNYIEYA